MRPSHFTRGKDGAPSEVFPPLSADADKGDQDAVVLASIPEVCGTIADGAHHGGGLNGQDAYSGRIIPWPQETADPIVCAEGKTYTHEGKVFRTRNVVSDGESLAVRRLTPRECERLQGFPDDYTLIEYRAKPAADGNRYKALGNSMAVNVMRWIGERIALVEARAAGVHDLSCDLGKDYVCGAAS